MSSLDKIIKYTNCPYNCWPINCGIRVIVKNNTIVETTGNELHDASRGMLCVKGQSCREIHDNKNRILSPLKRVGKRGENNWEKISWDEALNIISEKMLLNISKNHPEANALYHSHGNIVQRMNWKILTPRFANMAKMTLWDGNFPCWYDVGVAQELVGYYGYHDTEDIGLYSDTLINWAQDPCASMANMTPYIIQLKERGGTVVTIDPRVTQTAAISDIHIKPRIGSDVILANGIANALISENSFDENFINNYSFGFEKYSQFIKEFTSEKIIKECEISKSEFDKLVNIYAESKPLCLNLTRGALGKHWNGVPMVQAILCLTALSGNIGTKGGGVIWGERVGFNLSLQNSEHRPKEIIYPQNNFNDIDNAFNKKIVNTLLVVGGNPLSQWPNLNKLKKQIHNLDLVVVNDLYMNHTAREVGDIFLPATSWLEELGLRNSIKQIYLMDKIFEPQGDSKEASWWMNELANKLNISHYFPWQNKEECLNDCLDSEVCKGITVEKLRTHPEGMKLNLPEIPYSDFKFTSPSGKFEFYSQKALELDLSPLPIHIEPIEGIKSTPDLAKKYPLQLISSRRNSHFHSFHDSHKHNKMLQRIEAEPTLFIHPMDAVNRNIKNDSWAELFNDRGISKVKVEFTTEVSLGYVSLNDCWPELNILTSSETPINSSVTKKIKMGGQPSYQNTLVNIREIKN